MEEGSIDVDTWVYVSLVPVIVCMQLQSVWDNGRLQL